ncbi:MAG: acylphosphatase [Methanomicrobiaceae archaeon]|nr:acylphosphatase [Methanomicrobiaceae archaeon]
MIAAAKRRAHVWVSGRVQGVYFRDATRESAERFGVAGWVRNLPDGRVEAVFEGDPGAVDRIVEFCRRGPRSARIERVVVEEEDFREEFRGFEVRYG